MKAKKVLLLFVSVCLILVFAALPFMTACSTTTEANTLKIGYIGWLENFVGLNTYNAIQVKVDMINQEGGLTIGGDTYNIELIAYDSNFDQATMTAAVNRLIFEDEVDFIASDGFGIDAVISITEANKVVLCSASVTTAILSPDNHYSFMCSGNNTNACGILGWFTENYPDLKTIVIALPDNAMGHTGEAELGPKFEAFGMTPSFEYYPADATDLSSLGTKVKTSNPDVFACSMGTAIQPFAAVRQAGYTGVMMSPSASLSTADLLTVLSADQLEGYVGPASSLEFEPALTQEAQDFKEAWIAKFGDWSGPDVMIANNFFCLIAALQEAGSLDPDDVADVIGNGLEFDTPSGLAKMISRPDLGNDRTIDSVHMVYMKRIVGGESEVLGEVGIDEVVEYFQLYLSSR